MLPAFVVLPTIIIRIEALSASLARIFILRALAAIKFIAMLWDILLDIALAVNLIILMSCS